MSTRVQARPVPDEIRERLLGSFVTREAGLLATSWNRSGYPGYLHPGDPFGTVLAWLWHDDPDRAVALLGELLAGLRGAADVAAGVDVEALLSGLRLALPPTFPDDAYAALAARARTELAVTAG